MEMHNLPTRVSEFVKGIPTQLEELGYFTEAGKVRRAGQVDRIPLALNQAMFRLVRDRESTRCSRRREALESLAWSLSTVSVQVQRHLDGGPPPTIH